MHNNMVTTGGVKMGKSLGNSAFLRDLYKQYDPLSLRFTILQSHYRGTTEFTEDAIISANTGYQRLLRAYDAVAGTNADQFSSPVILSVPEDVKKIEDLFVDAMDDDFNTAKALASLYDLATLSNENQSFGFEAHLLQKTWQKLAGDILGILPTTLSTPSNLSTGMESAMQLLLKQRKAARDRRDFATSDSIRKELEEAGIILEDTKDGTTWRLK